jgi:hypothetical protein
MRKVVVSVFLTLDGVMEDPGGSEGFRHGGWQLPLLRRSPTPGTAWPPTGASPGLEP